MKTVACIFMALFVGYAASFSKAGDPGVDTTAKESVQPALDDARKAEILKAVVVSVHGLLAAEPELESNRAYQKVYASVSSALVLFDPLRGSRALRTFASLDSYYLGELSGEIYDCLALRKGKALEPYLEEILNANTTECVEPFGKDSPPGTSPSRSTAICLNRKELVERTQKIMRQIDAGVGCSDPNLL